MKTIQEVILLPSQQVHNAASIFCSNELAYHTKHASRRITQLSCQSSLAIKTYRSFKDHKPDETTKILTDLLAPQEDLLLLEVPSLLLIDEDKTQEVLDRELVLNILVCGCQVKACQVQSHWYALVLPRCAIHNLE